MLWVGNQLSPIEQLCMKSFLYHGHQVDLYAYTDIKGVPSGVNMCDANEIVESEKVFKHMGSYAAFADLFRWALLLIIKAMILLYNMYQNFVMYRIATGESLSILMHYPLKIFQKSLWQLIYGMKCGVGVALINTQNLIRIPS